MIISPFFMLARQWKSTVRSAKRRETMLKLKWPRTELLSCASKNTTWPTSNCFSRTSKDRKKSSRLISNNIKNLMRIGTTFSKRPKRMTKMRLLSSKIGTRETLRRIEENWSKNCLSLSNFRPNFSIWGRSSRILPNKRTTKKRIRCKCAQMRWKSGKGRFTWRRGTRKYSP